ncbi:Hypothetical predicted protein [Cloeon dipterum]|uniref:Uncharacterized protein n=1 Tax=Cloeon dipterum TaxID=197152 RepID=A0A8S1C8I8_9INSE|nr:Hypothetical predicted protein [Cloeon dipterum]
MIRIPTEEEKKTEEKPKPAAAVSVEAAEAAPMATCEEEITPSLRSSFSTYSADKLTTPPRPATSKLLASPECLFAYHLLIHDIRNLSKLSIVHQQFQARSPVNIIN